MRERIKESYQRDFKANHEYLHNVWTPALYSRTEADFGIPVDVANHLLSAYFNWQNSFHNFVYKPRESPRPQNCHEDRLTRTVFMKDLVSGGPYCSRFLLTSIFALAARHCSHESPVYRDRGEQFVAVAKELWVSELSNSKPTVATIQALLILGCRQCGIGNTSEGWLFSGMVRTSRIQGVRTIHLTMIA